MKNYKKIFSKLVILSCILCNLAVSNINAVVYRTSQEINIDNRNAFIVKMLKYTSVTAGIVTVGVGSLYSILKWCRPGDGGDGGFPIGLKPEDSGPDGGAALPLTYKEILPLTWNGFQDIEGNSEILDSKVQFKRGAGIKKAKKAISDLENNLEKILENTNFNLEKIKALRETEKQINKEYENLENIKILDESLGDDTEKIDQLERGSIGRETIESAIKKFSEKQSKAQRITDLTLSQLSDSSTIGKSTK